MNNQEINTGGVSTSYIAFCAVNDINLKTCIFDIYRHYDQKYLSIDDVASNIIKKRSTLYIEKLFN